MAWTLYDYVDRGYNPIKEWSKCLSPKDLAKLNVRLGLLEMQGMDLLPRMLAGPIRHHRHLYKLIINGRVALRPLLTRGPVDNNGEFTLLIGAFEKGFRWEPANALATANQYREEIKANPTQKRRPHEPVLRAGEAVVH